MSSNSFLLLLSIGFAVTFPPGRALASRDIGNGGNGIVIEGKAYVLDLVEAGVEKNPYFTPGVATDPALLSRVKANLPRFPEVASRMASKLSEIEKFSPSLAWALVEGFRFFNFRIVNAALVEINDDDSVVDYPSDSLVQLAIRREKSIFINGNWWPQLDVDQKVALLMHEIVYAFQNTVTNNCVEGQDSAGARAIVGFLFSDDIMNLGLSGLARAVDGQSRLNAVIKQNTIHSKIAKAVTQTLNTTLVTSSTGFYFTESDDPFEAESEKYLGELTKHSSTQAIAKICKKIFSLPFPTSQAVLVYKNNPVISFVQSDSLLGLTIDLSEDYIGDEGDDSNARESIDGCIAAVRKHAT